MLKTLIRACPACRNDRGEVKHVQRVAVPDELRFADCFDVVSCTRCGCTFADIPNAQSDIDESYKEHSKYADTSLYADEATPSGAPEAPWDIARLRGVADHVSDTIGRRDARILDAGCASGTFLGLLKERGFTALWGIEPSPLAAATARRLHHVQAITGSFVTPPETIGRFDFIALQHVLEHITDVREALSSLFGLLNVGGLAYIEVPDAQHYADHLVAPYHDFNTEHINHFSIPVMRAMMEDAGFETVSTAEKVVMCAPRRSYPALYGTWRRPAIAAVPGDARSRDLALVHGIDRYVEESSKLMDAIDARLRSSLQGEAEVIVWGAGQLSMKLLRDTVLAEKHVVAIVDGSAQKQGLHMHGSIVVSPAAAREMRAPIVITSIHHQDAILAAIERQFGAGRRVIVLS